MFSEVKGFVVPTADHDRPNWKIFPLRKLGVHQATYKCNVYRQAFAIHLIFPFSVLHIHKGPVFQAQHLFVNVKVHFLSPDVSEKRLDSYDHYRINLRIRLNYNLLNGRQ